MTQNSPLDSLRRRWWVVALFVVAGAAAGALPAPAEVEEVDRTFTATHTLLLNDTSSQTIGTVISPNQVSLFVTTGEVPARVAEQLDFTGNPATLASQVSSGFDFATGALTVTSNGQDPDRVEDIANAFADELVVYLAERQDLLYQERLAAALERLADVEQQLAEITAALATDPDDAVLLAQQSAIARQYSVAFEQNEALSASPPVIGFTTLQRAQAVEITDTGITAPRSRSSRAILGGIVGGALGVGIALMLGVLDRKIRTKEQAEEVLGLRAQVTIPVAAKKDRQQLVVQPTRHDPLSDAYRTVRTVVAFAYSDRPADAPAPITIVVSPSPADGKTSLAANLAAASAAAGQRTVLVNADFRRPQLAATLGPDAESPLPYTFDDVKLLDGPLLLNRVGIRRLRLLDLSRVEAPASDLVRATASKLVDLAAMCDHVIIDTSPIGATAEVLELVPHADAVVLTVRVGNTTTTQSKRAIGLLRDLTDVPTLLAVSGVRAEGSGYYEYDDHRVTAGWQEATAPATKRRFGRRRSRAAETPADPQSDDTGSFSAFGDDDLAPSPSVDDVSSKRPPLDDDMRVDDRLTLDSNAVE